MGSHRDFSLFTTRPRPAGVKSTASALPPGVRVIVTRPFASKPLRLVLTLLLSWPRATSACTRSSWLARMVPRRRWSSARSQARMRRCSRDRRSVAMVIPSHLTDVGKRQIESLAKEESHQRQEQHGCTGEFERGEDTQQAARGEASEDDRNEHTQGQNTVEEPTTGPWREAGRLTLIPLVKIHIFPSSPWVSV